ncbi:hypothetical protein G6F31_015763 [Rhizopus arrhizus]|nr:hypothetical protein G6F31_015763 [Rhizopus arrhizus]
MRLRPVAPRARRIADSVASVPELTMRTISHDGTRRVMVSAMVTSAAHGAPNERPLSMAFFTAWRTAGWLWPTIIGPQEPT